MDKKERFPNSKIFSAEAKIGSKLKRKLEKSNFKDRNK